MRNKMGLTPMAAWGGGGGLIFEQQKHSVILSLDLIHPQITNQMSY